MSKEKKNMVKPDLRFPEFKDPWSCLNGDELFEQISDKNHSSDLPILAITQEHGAIPREMIDYNVSVTDKSIESYKVVQVGDFIISLRSFQGGIEYSEIKGLCSPAYIILRKKKERHVVNDFFKYYFKTNVYIRDLNKNLEGIRDGKMVSYKQFSEIKNPYPEPEEQQKIASCLSSLDDLITAHTQKLEALKQHKKGLMQQLFPAEGEKVPRLRFKEFEGVGDWEEKTIGDYYKNLSTGMTPSRSNPEYFKGKIPWITSGELNFNVIYDTKEYITEEAIKDTNLKIYPPNTFFIAITGLEASGTRGKCAFNGVNAATNQSCMAFETNPLINSRFLYYWYVSFTAELYKNAQGTKQQSFNNAIVEKFKFCHPTIKEQQKIASCLSSLDELIKAQADKIEQLKWHKKGLMQGLFPTLNDGTV